MTLLGVLGTNEIVIIVIFLSIVPAVFFFLTQHNTLAAIQPKNRNMSPGEVWLQFIPLFGIVWQFFVVSRIADAIQRELASEETFSFEIESSAYRVEPYGPKPTHSIGMTYCTLICCGIIPFLGIFASLAGFICWIIYWVQLAEYKNKIQMKQYAQYHSPDQPQY